MFVHRCIYLFGCLFICLSASLFICLFVCLSLSLFIRLFVCLPIFPFIIQFTFSQLFLLLPNQKSSRFVDHLVSGDACSCQQPESAMIHNSYLGEWGPFSPLTKIGRIIHLTDSTIIFCQIEGKFRRALLSQIHLDQSFLYSCSPYIFGVPGHIWPFYSSRTWDGEQTK